MEENSVVKLVLLGDVQVGKTSLLARFMAGSTPGPWVSTVGVAYHSKKVCLQGVLREFRMWDTAGQESYRGLAPMYYRNAGVAILVFDITQKKHSNLSLFGSKNFIQTLTR
jgi:small GTP-binding protein